MPVICLIREADYFLRGEWTGQITLGLLGKLVSGRIQEILQQWPGEAFWILS
jgi:hypothetical protein